MSDPIGKLDPETHRHVFTDTVVPNSALPHTTPQAQPHAIVLAGQPGAGKGNLVLAARLEFSRNIVTIDPDAQREFHPDFKKLRESHPYTWSGHTHHDASRWAGELRDAAVAGRRNLIVDTTLGNAEGAIQTVKGLQAKGYSVEVRAIATHRLESELGVDQRFTDSLREKGFGRHVPGDFHDAAYKALPASLDKVHEQTGARIRIYNREGAELYDSRATPNLKPSIALEQAREARMADPKITRGTAEDARTQQDFHRKLPETVERNPKISPATATNLPPERQAQSVVPRIEHTATEATAIDRSVRIEPGAARVALGLKAAGTAALAHDALTAGQDTRNLLDQNNLTGAQSQVMHFAGRNLGMVAGAMAVGSAAAAAGIETGPGAVAAGLAGGVLGAVAGNKIMDAVDQSRIYNQRGSDGNLWNLDPKQPEQGWTRLPRPGEFGPQGPPEGAGYKNHLMYAAPRLADELNYKASNVAVELALAYAPVPKNPFSQPAGPGDAPAADATLWTRDPATRQWSRYVADPTMAAVGVPTGSTEQASPQRSAQLDQAAQAVMASNIAHSAQAIAQRYQADYNSYGWSQHGPVPMAVTTAIQAPPSQQRASDGHQYTQGANGQWTTPGTLYGINTAQGHVRDELNATRQQVQAPPAAPVARQESRTSPAPLAAGRMRFAEAHKRRDEPEQISAGSLQPVGKLDASHLAKGSPLYRMHQAQEQDLMRGLGIAQAQDWERFRNEPSLQQRPSVERTQDRTHRHLLEEVPVQKQPAPPVPAAQTPPPTRGEHAMAPSAAADIAAAQAQVAAAQAELAEMRQQMARMAGQRGQGGLERRDGNDPKEATQPPAATSRPELRIDHPGHPGHELFLQAREHMRALDARMGRSSDQRTDNMAACLAVQACRSGLERIDGVDIGTSGKDVWMAQGPLGTVWMKVAGVPVESADVPVQQTSQGWEQAQQFAQQQQADKHQEQQEHQRVQQQGNDQGPTR